MLITRELQEAIKSVWGPSGGPVGQSKQSHGTFVTLKGYTTSAQQQSSPEFPNIHFRAFSLF